MIAALPDPDPEDGEPEGTPQPLVSRHDDILADMAARSYPQGLRNRARYDHLRQRWHVWNKVRWEPDYTGKVFLLLRDRLNLWFKGTNSPEIVKELMTLLNVPKKKSVLENLSWRPGVAMDGSEWDPDPHLLGAPNGIIDLRTGELIRSEHPEYLVTRSVACEYDPTLDPVAACPRFMTFLGEIMAGDVDMVAYLLRVFGYALFGLQTEQKFWLFTGQGNNGKGVLNKVVMHVMGDYAGQPAQSLYMRSKRGDTGSSGPRADLVSLQGLRFTPMSEPTGGAFNDEMLKAHSGDDPIRARALYSNREIQFRPTHTIIFSTNKPPTVEDVGKSMQRRVRVVPFTEDFSGPRMDRELEAKLKGEAPGILRLLVMSAVAWYQQGLDEPEKVTAASQAYIEDNDPISEFVYDRCVVEPRATAPAKLLHDEYNDWAKSVGEDTVNGTGFGNLMSKRFRKTRMASGIVYQGLRLKSAVEWARDKPDPG